MKRQLQYILAALLSVLAIAALIGAFLVFRVALTQPDARALSSSAQGSAGALTKAQDGPLWPSSGYEVALPGSLFEALVSSSEQADGFFRGKTLAIHGTVGLVATTKPYFAEFKDPQGALPVRCFFSEPAQITKLLELQSGQTAQVVGTLDPLPETGQPYFALLNCRFP